MARNLAILLTLAAIVALPFVLRSAEVRDSEQAWRDGDPVLVIVTPHNEAIRHEFALGFSAWHKARFGQAVKVDWRNVGGTTEIARYLTSEYAAAMRSYWTRTLGKAWPDGATDSVTSSARPTEPGQREVYDAFRALDAPAAFTVGVDLFFGGGEFDHTDAFRRGLTVEPWPAGRVPRGLFALPDGTTLIPERISGEVWRTPTLFGNAVSTFGICYNLDRLRELGFAGLPAAWDDLADPRFFKQVGVADPDKSGSVAKAFEMLIHQKMHQAVLRAGFTDEQAKAFEAAIPARGPMPASVPPAYQRALEQGWLDGLWLVQRIGGNARYFTDSASKVPIDISVGDAAVGMAIDFYGRYQAQVSVGPGGRAHMGYLTPIGGSSVSCDPISLLRGAPHRQVAVRFVEFTLSEEGQRLWTYRPGTPGGPRKYALRRLPVRRDFYPSTRPALQAAHERHRPFAADDLADPAVDPYELSRHFTYHRRWTGSHFSAHRRIIRAMCVDAGPELKDAWGALIRAGLTDKPDHPAMQLFRQLPAVALYNRQTGKPDTVELTWRTAPDILRTYDQLDYMRAWTAAFRHQFKQVEQMARSTGN